MAPCPQHTCLKRRPCSSTSLCTWADREQESTGDGEDGLSTLQPATEPLTLPQEQRLPLTSRITPSRHRACPASLGPQSGRTGARLLWELGQAAYESRGHLQTQHTHSHPRLLKTLFRGLPFILVLLPQIYTFIHLIKNVRTAISCISYQHVRT